MATPIQMPALSPTMKEGKITRWLKKEGDQVKAGEAVAEVETDKSNLEVEVYDDGVLLQIAVKEGDMAPVGAPIAFVGEKGEKIPAAASGNGGSKPSAAKPSEPSSSPGSAREAAPAAAAPKPSAPPSKQETSSRAEAPPSPTISPKREGRTRASPLAKRMAKERGLTLDQLSGSGPNGRIVKRDIEAALEHGTPSKAAKGAPTAARAAGTPPRETTSTALSGMRKVIAQRMSEVKPGVPHFYLTIEVEMDAAMKIREEAKALDTKVSVNDVIVKAAAVAVRNFPKINVQYGGDTILQLGSVDVGVAVAIEDGLITPVVRDADQKGLAQISAETRDLAERARRRALKPAEYTGGSLTVSNLGMFGIDEFIAVINPPQAAILAVGSVADKAVVRNGQIVIRKMMSVTLSGDHRVIDGAVGAQYLQIFKALLENPLRLLF